MNGRVKSDWRGGGEISVHLYSFVECLINLLLFLFIRSSVYFLYARLCDRRFIEEVLIDCYTRLSFNYNCFSVA